MISMVQALMERGGVPDALSRAGIRHLVAQGLAERDAWRQPEHEDDLIADLKQSPIAIETDAANAQHYEVPALFFEHCLGRHRKYSGCYFPAGVTNLDDAEAASLRETCLHADLHDGQRILELGCGWGSLSLWMAAHYPNAQITAVSNSSSQRAFIETQCQSRGLQNLHVITANMIEFDPGATFDRVVSVEMFEHMRNYQELLRRIASWLDADGKLLVHIFTHRRCTYLFESRGPADWMSEHFFTGGIMPAMSLLPRFDEHLVCEQQWHQPGRHYEKTANAWLRNLDAQTDRVRPILRETYGETDAERWRHRWRLFYMACAELFGYDKGREWGVTHYRFVKR